MKIDVRADVAKARRTLRSWQQSALPKATAAALNRMGDQARTLAVKELAAVTGLKQKDVRAGLSRQRATWSKLSTAVIAIGKSLNLIRFGARQTKAGVSASAWDKRRIYPGTFIANQGRTVFRRETVGGKRVGRLPIVPVHGPSLPREMAKAAVMDKLAQAVQAKWPAEFARQLQYYLSKLA